MLDKYEDNLYSFPTEDKDFYTRFNFRRIVEQRPLDNINETVNNANIAVHLHLYYLDLLPEMVTYLKSIPCGFDLYISIPEQQDYDTEELQESLRAIDHVREIVIKNTPNRGRDIAPMLCSFKEELQRHDFLLHIHTKKSPYGSTLAGWRKFIMNHLLRTKETVTYILKLLSDDMGMVAPPDFTYCYDAKGWTANMATAQAIIDRTNVRLNLEKDVPCIKFPQGSMFWCRTDFLKELFSLPWKYEDFPEEPIPTDGTIAHAIERLLFICNNDKRMKCCMIYQSEDELQIRSRVEEEIAQHAANEKKMLDTIQAYQVSITAKEETINTLHKNMNDLDKHCQERIKEIKTDSVKTREELTHQIKTLEESTNRLSRKKRKYKKLVLTLAILWILTALSLTIVFI